MTEFDKASSQPWALIIGAFIMAAGAIVCVALWVQNSDDTDDGISAQRGYLGLPSFDTNPLAWHPAFMIGAFCSQLVAICTWSMIPTPTKEPKLLAKSVHVLFNMGAAGCMITALIAIVKHMFHHKLDSLTTVHSWVGVVAVCFFGMAYIWGATMAFLTAFYPDSIIREAIDLRGFHRLIGTASLFLMVAAIATGVMDQLGQGSCYYIGSAALSSDAHTSPEQHYFDLPDSCKIAHGMVILVIVGGFITVYLVSIRDSDPGHVEVLDDQITPTKGNQVWQNSGIENM